MFGLDVALSPLLLGMQSYLVFVFDCFVVVPLDGLPVLAGNFLLLGDLNPVPGLLHFYFVTQYSSFGHVVNRVNFREDEVEWNFVVRFLGYRGDMSANFDSLLETHGDWVEVVVNWINHVDWQTCAVVLVGRHRNTRQSVQWRCSSSCLFAFLFVVLVFFLFKVIAI